jgi:hypothetical protein
MVWKPAEGISGFGCEALSKQVLSAAITYEEGVGSAGLEPVTKKPIIRVDMRGPRVGFEPTCVGRSSSRNALN